MSGDRIALITARRMPEGWYDDESPQVAKALQEQGIPTDVVPWNHDIEWNAYRLAVLRSPWDMYTQLDEFFDWLDDTAKRVSLLNPKATVEWNLDKRYFLALNSASLETVPTQFVEVGETVSEFPASDFVVKPTTSASAMQTTRYKPTEIDRALAHIARLHEQELGAMVQPYMTKIDELGERSLVFIDGVFDHGVRKGGALETKPGVDTTSDAVNSHPNPQPYQPADEELNLARSALSIVPQIETVLYARVDLVTGVTGKPAIMELELFDPTLFMSLSEGTCERFADAIARRFQSEAH